MHEIETMVENDDNKGQQQENGAEKVPAKPPLFSQARVDDVDPDMGIHHLGVRGPEHDAQGIEMPLQFFQ